MDTIQTKAWMEAFYQALKARDARATVSLFSEDSTYEIVDPFEEWTDYGLILRGRSEYYDWLEGYFAGFERWRVFEYEILSSKPGQEIGHLRVYWNNSSSNEQLGCDMIHLATLDSSNLCTSLRDWSRVRSRD